MRRGKALALAVALLGMACGVKAPPRPPDPRPATPDASSGTSQAGQRPESRP